MSDPGHGRTEVSERATVEYGVRVVEDDALEGGVPWVFARQDGHLWFLLRESVTRDPRVLEQALTEAWATNRSIERGDLLSWAS